MMRSSVVAFTQRLPERWDRTNPVPVIKSIHIAPVKSLALIDPESVHVSANGIEEDRRFLVRNDAGAMITQRQIGKLAQVKTGYSLSSGTLRLDFPNGESVSGMPELGRWVEMKVFQRMVSGQVVAGELSEALSDFCGEDLTLVKPESAGMCQDAYPVSLLSQASIEHLGNMAQNGVTVEYRRFRPNFLLDGCAPHEEDTWLDREVAIGDELRLRVEMLDPRCAITTLNPDTGKRDMDTLRLILGYRPGVSDNGACFGVYGSVVTPGAVSVGDTLKVMP